MKKRTFYFVFSVLVLSFVLSACGPDLDEPAGVTEAFFNAYEDKDTDKLKDLVCEDYQDDIPDFEDIEDDEDVEVRFNFDLQFEEDERDSDFATVKIYGSLKTYTATDEGELEIKQRSRGDKELAVIDLRREDGDWKVCDGIIDGLLFGVN